MDENVKILKRIYDGFNARDIDGVLNDLTADVVWANGMEGGHVYGPEAIRDYWSRQWAMVNSHVEPVEFRRARTARSSQKCGCRFAISTANRCRGRHMD